MYTYTNSCVYAVYGANVLSNRCMLACTYSSNMCVCVCLCVCLYTCAESTSTCLCVIFLCLGCNTFDEYQYYVYACISKNFRGTIWLYKYIWKMLVGEFMDMILFVCTPTCQTRTHTPDAHISSLLLRHEAVILIEAMGTDFDDQIHVLFFIPAVNVWMNFQFSRLFPHS